MPAYDLRGIKVATYTNNSGTVTYSNVQTIGDAMNVNLSLRRAEGRLYAESTLAEFMPKVIGGTISIGVKYIPDAAQKILFGATEKTRTVSSKTATGLEFSAKDETPYVGVAFYAPAKVDGAQKYRCVFVKRALFGAPDMVFQTMGESITFQTPTTVGEFMADHSTSQGILETALVDTETEATAWVAAVLA